MSIKQDRSYARTAQDIERKYSFGKTFAEMLGLINENRDKVDSVESGLRDEIRDTSTELKRSTDEIVMKAKSELTGSINSVSEDLTTLSSEVEMKLDSTGVSIAVEEELAKGVERVVTKSGYEFGADGLNISKSGEEMKNKLTHKGMYVTKNDDEILTADKDGVKATDLHAKTYLVVGKGKGRSRFEDYGIDRTACFWIGG